MKAEDWTSLWSDGLVLIHEDLFIDVDCLIDWRVDERNLRVHLYFSVQTILNLGFGTREEFDDAIDQINTAIKQSLQYNDPIN